MPIKILLTPAIALVVACQTMPVARPGPTMPAEVLEQTSNARPDEAAGAAAATAEPAPPPEPETATALAPPAAP